MTDAIAKLVDDMNETELRAALIKLGSTRHQEVVSAIVDVLDATRAPRPRLAATDEGSPNPLIAHPPAGTWNRRKNEGL